MLTEVYRVATGCFHGRFQLDGEWFESRGPLGGNEAEAKARMLDVVASMYVGEEGEQEQPVTFREVRK